MSIDLYSYFRDIKEDLTEEDKKKIDTLFNNLLLERQEGIMGYIAGKYHWSDRKGRKAIYDIQILKKQFQNNKQYKDIYFYFKSIQEDLTEADKKKIDELFHSLSLERQEGINGYLAGKYHCSDFVGKKARVDIRILKRQFKRLQLPQKDKTLYDYFRSIKENLTEEDKKKIDELFHSLSIERQEGIKGYIVGKCHQSNDIASRAKKDIMILKKQFKSFQIPQRNLYDYFKSDQEELTVEDIHYIDSLLLDLPLENQRGILEYLQNKHLKTSFIARRARFDLGIMQNKFRDRKKEILIKRLELLRVLQQVLNEEKAKDKQLRLMRK